MNNGNTINQSYLTVREVAEILKITVQTTRKLLKDNKILYYKVGKNIRIPVNELEKLMKIVQEWLLLDLCFMMNFTYILYLWV